MTISYNQQGTIKSPSNKELPSTLPAATPDQPHAHPRLQAGLTVGGPAFPDASSSLLVAMGTGSCPCVLKMLLPPLLTNVDSAAAASGEASNSAATPNCAAGGPEAAACRALCHGKPATVPLVDAKVITFTLGKEHASTHGRCPGVYAAIQMQYYISTVARLPPAYLQEIPAMMERMVEALEWIHRKGFVHMDVKVRSRPQGTMCRHRAWVTQRLQG